MEIGRYLTDFKIGKEVIGPSGIPGAFDGKAVDSPFVFRHNGRFYMLYVGFDGKGYQTALAVSHDLLSWKKEALLFSREEGEAWDAGGVAGNWILRENELYGPARLKKAGGKYWMVYHSYPGEGYEAGPARIGLAYTEDETLHHWTRLDNPVLSWEDGADWEKGGLYKGCLVESGELYYLFYNAKNSSEWLWREQIGVAVSENLLNWKRLYTEPVIRNTAGAWDSCFCADPCVVKDGKVWLMFYYGYDGAHAQEGIAYSEDLLHWTKHPDPILRHGGKGEIDEFHAHKPGVITKDGHLYHFYCAVRPGRAGDRACNADPTDPTGGEARTEYRCISAAGNGNWI